MTREPPLDLTALAQRFGKSYNWMSHNIGRLKREHGFPGCIPGLGKVYDPVAVDEWLARQRGVVAAPRASAEEPLIDWSALLDLRAAAMAPAQGGA